MPRILALDQGTTSSRAIVFDERGNALATARQEIRVHLPRAGWVEQDPGEIWQSQRDVAREAVRKSGLGWRGLDAIGITNQRETTVLWNRRTGEPVANAIVWQDRRTADRCERLAREGLLETFRSRTGLVLDPYFSATKLQWLLAHVDGARDAAGRGELAFGTVDSWLMWQLSAGALHVTDATNASRTLMYDIHRGDWDDELLEILDIPRSLLPEVRGCSEVYGESDAGILGGAVPMAGMAGDQHAALFGQMCVDPGMAKNTYGTGCFLLMNTGEQAVPSANNLLTTLGWQRNDDTVYALEGSVFVAGAVVQWLRDGLGLVNSSSEVEALARQVPDTGGVYFVPALTGLGAPHWDPYARGTMVGLTRGTTGAHLARAALEAIAFQSAEVVHAMEADAGVKLAEFRVDGGAAANDLLMQFQADLLGVPLARPRVMETTALGAACLAGLGVSAWPDPEALRKLWQAERTFEPVMSRDEATARMADWQRAVKRAQRWATP